MKEFLCILLFMCIMTTSAWGATNCRHFVPTGGEDTSQRAYIERKRSGEFFYCGEHSGDDNGCSNRVDVWAKGGSGLGFYTCYVSGSGSSSWAYTNPISWISDCTNDPETEYYGHNMLPETDGTYWFFYDWDSRSNGGAIHQCKISPSTVDSYLSECVSSGGSKHGIWCSCYSPYEDDGPYKCRLAAKYGYKPCNSDADCVRIDNTKSPYRHSTAWRCWQQNPGVKVCTPKACENGWHVTNGICKQDEQQQQVVYVEPGVQRQNHQQQNPVQPSPSPTTNTRRQQSCTDTVYMDEHCQCTRVAETVNYGGKCKCVDLNKEIQNGKCEYTAAYRARLSTDIDNIYNTLKSTAAGFKKSEWKDSLGNFNTARLASDSIAGVVLGTVGGIVTANVIKKAQIKQGFEDIKCYIGGQSIANFGDEFVVGH